MRYMLRCWLVGMLVTGAVFAADRTYVLRGTIATPDVVIRQGSVVVTNDTITAVAATVTVPDGAPVIDVDGAIYPGLIDLHNHVTWNAFRRWRPPHLLADRYEWLAMDAYKKALDGPHGAIQKTNGCDLERFGEVKALVGGATAITGSLGPPPGDPTGNACDEGLIRNLDYASGLFGPGVNHEPLQYRIFPFELSPADQVSVRDALGAGKPVVVHLAEGKDASAAREFRMLKAHAFLHGSLTIIHGVGLTKSDFDEQAKAHAGLVWSPRSNIELYGRTTAIRDAKTAGIAIAISPDWSPSGSDGMLQELRYAARWNARQSPRVFTDKELVEAVTSTPARLGGVADKIGTIAPGMRADLLVVRTHGRDAYAALTHARPTDVKLVIIDGRPLYGDRRLVLAVNPAATVERVAVCGAWKVLDMSNSDGGTGVTWRTTVDRLRPAFRSQHVPMAAVTVCE